MSHIKGFLIYWSSKGILRGELDSSALPHALEQANCRRFPEQHDYRAGIVKYRLLNIFYNRDAEIEVLRRMAEEEQVMKQRDKKEYKRWLRKQRASFRKFLHEHELKRRRARKNLGQRPYIEALRVFDVLMEEIESFDTPVQKRLGMIGKNWAHLITAFYFVKGGQATNNRVEN